jgi:hypothetical protein
MKTRARTSGMDGSGASGPSMMRMRDPSVTVDGGADEQIVALQIQKDEFQELDRDGLFLRQGGDQYRPFPKSATEGKHRLQPVLSPFGDCPHSLVDF